MLRGISPHIAIFRKVRRAVHVLLFPSQTWFRAEKMRTKRRDLDRCDGDLRKYKQDRMIGAFNE
jgi:hypothetical protein